MQIFEKYILGFFISSNIGDEMGAVFHQHIWGENGIGSAMKSLKYDKYGQDLTIILVKFYVNPVPFLQTHLKEIGKYRKEERAIDVSFVVNEDNFFSKSEHGRELFLRDSISKGLELVRKVVERKKMDTHIELLITDINEIFLQRTVL